MMFPSRDLNTELFQDLLDKNGFNWGHLTYMCNTHMEPSEVKGVQKLYNITSTIKFNIERKFGEKNLRIQYCFDALHTDRIDGEDIECKAKCNNVIHWKMLDETTIRMHRSWRVDMDHKTLIHDVATWGKFSGFIRNRLWTYPLVEGNTNLLEKLGVIKKE